MASMQAQGDERDRGLSVLLTYGRRASTPVELASGRFTGKDGHAGRGTATVVRRNEKRVLTFTRFDVDPGRRRARLPDAGRRPRCGRPRGVGQPQGQRGSPAVTVPARRGPAPLLDRGAVVPSFTVRIATAPLSLRADAIESAGTAPSRKMRCVPYRS